MIFATDLDRTIIYSSKYINQPITNLKKISIKDKIYIESNTYNILKEISNKVTIIPVTNRNKEEYCDLLLFNEIYIKYLILCSGSQIFINNKEDKIYKAMLESKYEKLIYKRKQILEFIQNSKIISFIKKIEFVNKYGLLIKFKKTKDENNIKLFFNSPIFSSWNTYYAPNRVFLFPYFINKYFAIEYIKANYINEKIIAAGDSMLDYKMIKNANLGIIPNHSDFKLNDKNIIITKKSGILAGNEILSITKSYIDVL